MRGLLIDRAVLATLRETAEQVRFRVEVGGILLGCSRGGYLHVTDATTPQVRDRSGFSRFWRSPNGHQSIARRAWAASQHTVTYLGEWHSHPERHPSPSPIDYADWDRQVLAHRRELAFVIQGEADRYIALYPAGGAATPLELIDEDQRSSLWSPIAAQSTSSVST